MVALSNGSRYKEQTRASTALHARLLVGVLLGGEAHSDDLLAIDLCQMASSFILVVRTRPFSLQSFHFCESRVVLIASFAPTTRLRAYVALVPVLTSTFASCWLGIQSGYGVCV
ncbi:hypothetical protein FB451DRAFT_1209713 [Mycena latifolia]|nr:hypothetical protein FB451DRAFT_1209713 [Mycena latifolia]